MKRAASARHAEWYFFSGGPGTPRYGGDPTKHAVDHDTETFVREVLQNANDQRIADDTAVKVTFRFHELAGVDLESYLASLEWERGLKPRLEAVSETEHGRQYRELLDRLETETGEDDGDRSLRVLVVEDRNTTGLTGRWDEESNYAALVRDELFSSKQNETAGGSYGLGKSVLWTFSGASTVVFNSELPDPPAGRDSPRLIGRTKLPSHEKPSGNTVFQGAGWLCRPRETEDGVRPGSLWADEARELAADLRLARPSTSGTSIAVVDYRDPTRAERPDVDTLADEFERSAAKYFWPAIHRGDLRVTVETPESVNKVDIREFPTILPFVECYEHRHEDDMDRLEKPGDVAGYDLPVELPERSDGTETPNGKVRLAARLASPADPEDHLNSVALFRGAGMVVKYFDQSRVAFGDRNFFGVLSSGRARPQGAPTDADREVDRFLRFAEPPSHDEWESTENLREEYKYGFRKTLETLKSDIREGLRSLVAENPGGGREFPPRVAKKFPIHGGGRPSKKSGSESAAFDLTGRSFFEDGRWKFEGTAEPLVDEHGGWRARLKLTGLGEDGGANEPIQIEEVEVGSADVTRTVDETEARFEADSEVGRVSFSGRSVNLSGNGTTSGSVTETRLSLECELIIGEGDR